MKIIVTEYKETFVIIPKQIISSLISIIVLSLVILIGTVIINIEQLTITKCNMCSSHYICINDCYYHCGMHEPYINITNLQSAGKPYFGVISNSS